MKRLLSFAFIACAAFLTVTAQGVVSNNPVAATNAIVKCGNARFTVLTPEMIRIEYSAKGTFEDQATFTVVNRNLDVPQFTKTEDDTYLYITTSNLKLKYRKGTDPRTISASSTNLTIAVNGDGVQSVWYPGKPDPLNLKGTCRTLDGLMGDSKRSEMENGLVSRSGWAVIDDSWSSSRADGGRSYALVPSTEVGYSWWADRADNHAMDTYFLGYGHNYKKAIADFTKIAGDIPLPPDYVFGYWYSKYASYSADDYRNIMKDLKTNKIPTDVMILDMDWHWNGNAYSGSEGRGGWTGWSWNTNLIPNATQLLSEMHEQNFKTALNLHPADGINEVESPSYFAAMKSELGGKYLNDDKNTINWSLDYTDFTKSFFKNIIRDHEKEGVDFWWIDWQQHLTSPYTNSLSETFWCNHVFYNEAAKRTGHRPVIFHRWGGLGSHRYQIGFSGDANISYDALAFEPYFTATASNVGYGYWGHDLGGHMYSSEELVNNPNLVLRWIQFGVFTPIFRTHATSDDRIERRIWKFSNFPTILEAVRLRYTLFPYIYTMARKTYETGISLCRPLYYEYPEVEEAYTYDGEYFFGDDILVAPITAQAGSDGKTNKEIWFPEGKWWSASTHEMIEGPCKRTMTFTEEQIPYFFREGSVIPFNPSTVMNVTERPDNLVLHVVAGANGEGSLYEDDGDNADYATDYAKTSLKQVCDGNRGEYIISERQGSVSKAPQNRSYVMHIYNTSAPISAQVDGVSATFSYDEATHCTTVEVPSGSCSLERKVVVEYSPVTAIDKIGANKVSVAYDKTGQQLVASFGKLAQQVSLVVSNVAGKTLLANNYKQVDGFSEDLSMLMPQLYISKVVADSKTYVNKFIKE